jgi:hypothetical protein
VGRSSGLYEAGKRVEYFSRLTRVFETVARAGSFGLIAHNFRESQGAQDIADAGDASARGLGDLARIHLLAFGQESDDRKGNWIPKETAQPGLPVFSLIHGRDYYHVFAIAKTRKYRLSLEVRILYVERLQTDQFQRSISRSTGGKLQVSSSCVFAIAKTREYTSRVRNATMATSRIVKTSH